MLQDQYRANLEENLKDVSEQVVPTVHETRKGNEEQVESDFNEVKEGRVTATRPSYNEQELEFGGRFSHNDEQHYARAQKSVPRYVF